MTAPLVLSLFPGIGLLDMAFEQEGFCVVRGPDLLWGGDVRAFHPPAGKFEGIIGGPPCQLFSILKRLNPLAGEKQGNLIPEFERVVSEASPAWFVMENVEGAPLPIVDGYDVHAQLIRDAWVGGETTRLRRFSFGSADGQRLYVETLALHNVGAPAALAGGSGRETPVRLGGGGPAEKNNIGRTRRKLWSKSGRPRVARRDESEAGAAGQLPRGCAVHRARQRQDDRQRRSSSAGQGHRQSSEARDVPRHDRRRRMTLPSPKRSPERDETLTRKVRRAEFAQQSSFVGQAQGLRCDMSSRTGGPEHIGSIVGRVVFAILERAGVGAQPIPQPRP